MLGAAAMAPPWSAQVPGRRCPVFPREIEEGVLIVDDEIEGVDYILGVEFYRLIRSVDPAADGCD